MVDSTVEQMERHQKMSDLRRHLATAEYRPLSRQEKGLKLIHEDQISTRMAAEIVKVPRSTLRRAQRAQEEEREIGRWGKPPLFTENENQMLIERLKAVPCHTYRELREQVRNPSLH